ncbi:ATP-binding protein [Pleurocapsales cyanobacterium LEGE 10410]|nr:ATP-binding protein [Pleurocapsales cyanobacterium LEGE 10410]
MKVLRSITIKVPSDLKALDLVLSKFNQVYQDSIPLRDWLQCRLALAEGFTNAVKHAHKNLSSDVPITIEVQLRKTALEIRIWDYGSIFDLHGFITETAQKHDDWLASGRGIPILNKVCDRLDYYRTDQQQNCLLIIKKFIPRQSSACSKSENSTLTKNDSKNKK